jgi:hypothetical protein
MSSGSVRLEDNSRRGARTIFFLKFWYILLVVGLVLCNIVIEVTGYMSSGAVKDPDTARHLYYMFMAAVVPMIGTMAVCFILFWIFLVYWMLWLYRAIKNLRCLTTTTFSPNVAVVCSTFLPYIGHIFDVFILRDIARRQQKLLDERGIQYTPVTRRDLVIFFAFILVTIVVAMAEIAASWFGCFAVCAAIIGLMVSCLRVLRPCVEQGNMLYKLNEEDVLRAKVDEVLREREIEKAAREIQEAKFDE